MVRRGTGRDHRRISDPANTPPPTPPWDPPAQPARRRPSEQEGWDDDDARGRRRRAQGRGQRGAGERGAGERGAEAGQQGWDDGQQRWEDTGGPDPAGYDPAGQDGSGQDGAGPTGRNPAGSGYDAGGPDPAGRNHHSGDGSAPGYDPAGGSGAGGPAGRGWDGADAAAQDPAGPSPAGRSRGRQDGGGRRRDPRPRPGPGDQPWTIWRQGPGGATSGTPGDSDVPPWARRRPPWDPASPGSGGPRWAGPRHGPRFHPGPSGPLRRKRDGRMAGGVASAVADRLRVDPGVVRVLLVVSILASGIGVAAYMLAWLLIPLEGTDRCIAVRAAGDLRGIAILIAFSPVLVVTLIASSAVGNHIITTLDTALLLSGAGLFLVYRNADDDEKAWLRQIADSYLHLTPSSPRSKRTLAVRILAGVAIWAAGMVILTLGHISAAALRPLAGAVLLVIALALLFGPWWLRLGRDLMTERQARIRAEEWADMAARLHDSVLQTLALIQRQADDPQRVAQLARAQERELRSWLFEGRDPASPTSSDPTTVAAASREIAREVEAAHGVPVEVVTVGDCDLDDDLRALLAAGREATVNAAKWSKAPVVSLFAEVEPAAVSMFVRDRGVGFDPAAVPADRRGVAASIRARMSRHGGTATIRSEPGKGTEVELRMPRPAGQRSPRPTEPPRSPEPPRPTEPPPATAPPRPTAPSRPSEPPRATAP